MTTKKEEKLNIYNWVKEEVEALENGEHVCLGFSGGEVKINRFYDRMVPHPLFLVNAINRTKKEAIAEATRLLLKAQSDSMEEK